jgi:adenylyltransferase/sulfurtransferase
MNLTEEQIERYSRHIILPQIGGKGQTKLLNSKVFVLGAGGLGSPALLYLAAAGVGTIGIADADTVDLSNLQRQIIHSTNKIGLPKTVSAKQATESLNPEVNIITYDQRLTTDNIRSIIKDYDIILDGSDNFPTRFLMGDATFFERKILVSGSISQFDGQVSVFKKGFPCYRCLYSEPPPKGFSPNCQEAGILGALAGVIGTLQAVEAVKEILKIGKSLAGYLLIFDALKTDFSKRKIPKNKHCTLCSDNPSITELGEYEQKTCGIP